MAWPLAERFARRREQLEPSQSLDAALARMAELARAAWPALSPSIETFVEYVAARVPEDADAARAIAELHAADLYLACACALGDARAIAAFDREYLSPSAKPLARLRAFRDVLDEVGQRLRERLFAGPSPRIATYRGLGPLQGWVQIAAQRIALTLRRESQAQKNAEANDVAPRISDPELELLRARYAGDVQAALRESFARLTPAQRHLLRMHYAEGVSLEQLGRVHGVNRSTASRRVSAARALLLDETRALLRARLHLTPQSLDSLLRALASQLSLSLDLLAD